MSCVFAFLSGYSSTFYTLFLAKEQQDRLKRENNREKKFKQTKNAESKRLEEERLKLKEQQAFGDLLCDENMESNENNAGYDSDDFM